MSRIDEARRRAGKGSDEAATPGTLASLQSEAGADAVALAQEEYPVEVAEAPRAPKTSGPDPRVTNFHAAPTSSEPSDSPLFERIDARLNEKVVVDENMNAASREQYRRLAAVLHDAQSTAGLQVVMVASAVAGEGKTLTASNLALTLSESYQKRVLLIDGDLRRPTLHSVFRLDSASGLADGLLSTGETKMLVRQVSTRLAVLPAGRPSADPMAGLTSERMKRLLDEARQSFDWVILDTPPVMLLPDANLMASMVDGAVMVVRAGSTPHELVRRAADAVGRSRILGVVLNKAELTGQHDQYQYYGYDYKVPSKYSKT
jgi:protein-tyrosine kinase